MPLTIVRVDKPFRVRFGAAELHVTPMAAAEEEALQAAHPDPVGFRVALLTRVITGWAGVVDQEGTAVPFEARLIWHLRGEGQEPEEVLLRVLLCLRGLDDPLADRSRASSTPSSGGSNGSGPTPG